MSKKLRERNALKDTRVDLAKRIANYLSAGGLFNPEAMDHDKVHDLLIDCRNAMLAAIETSKKP